jgi:hypothetical protein
MIGEARREIGRAVQRIDHPRELGVLPRVSGLLRDDAVPGKPRANVVDDPTLGGQIGIGHDVALVSLVPHVDVFAEIAQEDLPCRSHTFQDGLLHAE